MNLDDYSPRLSPAAQKEYRKIIMPGLEERIDEIDRMIAMYKTFSETNHAADIKRLQFERATLQSIIDEP